ncbi:MAG TPA: alcohol dehydrogenase AdhP [Actinomycetota bacterium]|nr:alcohol dehydrogenase AdhP [Actinomycetota bacterium]
MKAAVVHDFQRPLEIEDVPQPTPGEGEVVVRIETAGLCHTDIHAAHGDWPVKPKLPLIPGHEGVGIIESLGSGVEYLREGQRVAIPWLGYACGICEYCTSGWETLCEAQRNTGYSVDGSYAEYLKASAAYVVKVPDGIDPFEAAPLTCAGVTTYKAVKMSGARSSDLVAVFGVGGLGHMAMQYARVAGASVVAVDLFDDKLQVAKELGAEFVVNARQQDPVSFIRELGGADSVIATAASASPLDQAFRALRRGGTLVLVGLPAENQMQLPIFETVLQGISVVGSIVGTRVDLAEVFELHRAGRTQVSYERRSLEQVNEAFEDVEAGRATSRLVFEL